MSLPLHEPTLTPPPLALGKGGNGNGDSLDGNGWHHEEGDRKPPIANLKFLAMLICASSVMLFTAFTGVYIVFRHAAGQWPPAGFPKPPDTLLLNTVVIVLSSAAMACAQWWSRRPHSGRVTGALALATLLGLTFVVLQFVAWQQYTAQGVSVRNGSYGSIFYAMTYLHAAHVLGGLAALLVATVQVQRQHWTDAPTALDAVGIYWHFVGAVWVYLYVILCLI